MVESEALNSTIGVHFEEISLPGIRMKALASRFRMKAETRRI